MRILWFNHRDPKHPQAGGSETHLFETAKRLVKLGNRIDVICERSEGLPAYEKIDGVSFYRVGNSVSIHLISLMTCLRYSQFYDVVVDDIAHAIPWFSPIVTRKVVTIIHHLHDDIIFRELDFPRSFIVYILEKLVPFFYRKGPIITVSESSKNRLVEMKVPENSVQVVHNGVDLSEYSQEGEKTPLPLILYLGRVKKYKNVDHLVEIFARVLKMIPCNMIIAGGGSELENIRGMVARMDLENHIAVLGHVNPVEKVRLMQEAWVFVTASMREGWGLTSIEAAACGTPTISYDVDGLRDSVIDGQTGYLVPYGDKTQFSRAVIRVLSDRSLRGELSRNAAEWAKSHSWDESSRELLDILESRARGN